MTVFAGSPGKLVADLPESSPELFEHACRDYYVNFKAA